DPVTGRFNRRDVFTGYLKDPSSLHKYLYAEGNPVNRTDPSGNFSLGVSLGIGAIVGGIIGGLVAWSVGYGGWGIAGGVVLGALIGMGFVLVPGLFAITLRRALIGLGVIAGLLVAAALYERYVLGDRAPNDGELANINRAIELIQATPGFQDYGNKAAGSI